jgi:2-polyprenyl-6-methoxyphenol hydroxylase-like FAD-dependent oxidoreductase
VIPLPPSTDVFVIGGGPAGLATAIAARRRGFEVTLADVAEPPIDKACGEGIMPDGIAAARALGIDLSAAGARPFRGIRFVGPDASVEAAFPSGYGLGLRRTALHRLMTGLAADCSVRMCWGARVAGLAPEGVLADGRLVRARWIVGADGGRSAVRQWAGLDACRRDTRRFGFRRHYRLAPWSEFMEIHWGEGCQLYITPVSAEEVCVVLISRDPRLRLEAALPGFPEVERRLRGAGPATRERGGITASRRLESVFRGRVALVGDASGSVDAITGEGLCLLFQQAVALAGALEAGDLAGYQAEHRRIGRRPALMADLMLMLDRRGGLRRRTLHAMAHDPRLFARLLAMHVGRLSVPAFLANGFALGWQMITV